MGSRQRKARSLLPWRNLLFLVVLAFCLPLLALKMPWYQALIVGFDMAALIRFPLSSEPEYWDFIYFAFTLGMTFQTSDTEITTVGIRRTAILHSLAAFVFNLGVLGFTINLLGGQS